MRMPYKCSCRSNTNIQNPSTNTSGSLANKWHGAQAPTRKVRVRAMMECVEDEVGDYRGSSFNIAVKDGVEVQTQAPELENLRANPQLY